MSSHLVRLSFKSDSRRKKSQVHAQYEMYVLNE